MHTQLYELSEHLHVAHSGAWISLGLVKDGTSRLGKMMGMGNPHGYDTHTHKGTWVSRVAPMMGKGVGMVQGTQGFTHAVPYALLIF